ncbi:MAG TPA: substrate-binding domain-containing protein [Flavipsychrobacter sp.]|nr:substrate-binding domain-containing protein [Flavipsychrobacter sp.]
MNRIKSLGVMLLGSLAIAACNAPREKKETDTLGKGSIQICVDETYKPIIEEQSKVFDSSFPEAHVTIHYKSETECIQDFLNDSARLILVTRDLNETEKKLCEQKKLVPTTLAIAKDAVAIIVNNNSVDTAFGMDELKGILTGTYKKKFKVVFDNQGSSTLRFLMDSLLRGQALGSNVYAAKGNDSVISYIAQNPDAIGFVGVSYVSDFNDTEGLAFIKQVKVASVYNDSMQQYFKPYQAYIAPNYYPLTRNLYYINRETYPGLGTGFANFLSKERGQLIFKQARLFPLRTNIIFRDAQINNK